MKRFTVPCEFGEQTAPFHVYIGSPSEWKHPLHYQIAWLRNERGGDMSAEVYDSFERLQRIARENEVSF